MRTKAQIKQEITNAFMGNELLAGMYGFAVAASFEATFSLVSLENILFDIIAFSVFVHEQMFDHHKKEVDQIIFEQKSGRLPWYRTMALAFQYGYDLVTDHDYYDNTWLSSEQIATAKIVKYAAVGESDTESRVIIKIAGEVAGVLTPIEPAQKASFDAYMKEVKYPGKLTVINYLPDRLYLGIEIKYDALVLDNNGMSILNGNSPVNDAIAEYMKELPFDGELRLSALIDKLQAVPGVKDATIRLAQTSWIDPESNGYGELQNIDVATIPVSGYFQVVTYDNITYVV